MRVAIVGSHSPEQISETVGAVDLDLAGEDRAEIEMSVKAAVQLVGPSPEAMPTESAP